MAELETTHDAGHHWVNYVFPDKDFGYVYTEGLFDLYGHPEFVAFDVPKIKVDRVCALMNFLGERIKTGNKVLGGQSLASQGLILGAQLVIDENLHRRLWDSFVCRANPDAQIIVLTPRFREASDWGSFPDAPLQKTKLRNIIFAKLQGRRLQWFIDGDKKNTADWNVQKISHYDAFSNNDLVVDWVNYLTEHEIDYVKNNLNHFAALYKPRPFKQNFTELDEREIVYTGQTNMNSSKETK